MSQKILALIILLATGLWLLSAGCGGDSPLSPLDALSGDADPTESVPVNSVAEDGDLMRSTPGWSQPLAPLFQQAAAAYGVPEDLLVTLAKAGSGFENRGSTPTIEGGYGLMALRQNDLGGDSLALAAQLTGLATEDLITDPAASLYGAAAVLSAYADGAGVDRAAGIEAWLPAVIQYAGLDEEDSKFFARGIYELLQVGFEATNRDGEAFAVAARELQTIDLASLVPPGMTQIPLEVLEAGIDPDKWVQQQQLLQVDYPGATWDPAASCNYTATVTSKDTIIIHTIEGTAAGARSWFKNCNSNVSAHYVISEAGGVWQCVLEKYKAWHVGCLNSRSIGFEHEGYASSSSHPTSLYNASALLARNICDRRGIAKAHNSCPPGILGHNNANNCVCGGTHWDPGSGWDWGYYINKIKNVSPPAAWAASYTGNSHPTSMEAGSTAIVWAKFKNTGTKVWTHDNMRLGTSSPQNRDSVFCTPGNWLNCHRPTEVDDPETENGQESRFTFILTAPDSAGTYTEKFKLVNSSGTYFGPEISWTITVKVTTPDTTPPSVPGTPTATAASTSKINLSWTGSTDNVGVTEYRIYRNDVYLDSTGANDLNYTNTGLAEGTTYSYRISAKDAAGNESAKSGGRGETTWIIVDNSEGGFTASTGWATSTSSSDKYGADYRWKSTTAFSDQAVWTFSIPTADNYQIYAWWSEGANRSTGAPYTVNSGSAIAKNQSTNGGQWNSLGTFSLATGSNNVKLSCWAPSGYVVVADAIRVIRR